MCLQPICCVQIHVIALSAWNTSESSGEFFTSQEKKKNLPSEITDLKWKRSFCLNMVRFQPWRIDAVWDMNKHCISSGAKRKAQTQLVSLLFCLKELMKLKAVIGMSIFSPLAYSHEVHVNVSLLTCSYWAVLIGLMT